MTVSELIETLERLKEYDPEVEVWILTDRGTTRATPRTIKITDVILSGGVVTIYGEEE